MNPRELTDIRFGEVDGIGGVFAPFRFKPWFDILHSGQQIKKALVGGHQIGTAMTLGFIEEFSEIPRYVASFIAPCDRCSRS